MEIGLRHVLLWDVHESRRLVDCLLISWSVLQQIIGSRLSIAAVRMVAACLQECHL